MFIEVTRNDDIKMLLNVVHIIRVLDLYEEGCSIQVSEVSNCTPVRVKESYESVISALESSKLRGNPITKV